MDFSLLLAVAKENSGKQKKSSSFSTKVEAAKKASRNKKLSENVKLFLEKREIEEKKLKNSLELKRKNLLELRSQNKKSLRTAKLMAKKCKGSDQGVTLNNNMEIQCDEDDYGFESGSCGSVYEKLMNRYSKLPNEDPFSRSQLKQKTLKDTLGKSTLNVINKDDSEEQQVKKTSDSIKNKSALTSDTSNKSLKKLNSSKTPPPSFQELLKIAEEKKKNPLDFMNMATSERNSQQKSSTESFEFDRPMTEKQKREKRYHINRTKSGPKTSVAVAPKRKMSPPPVQKNKVHSESKKAKEEKNILSLEKKSKELNAKRVVPPSNVDKKVLPPPNVNKKSIPNKLSQINSSTSSSKISKQQKPIRPQVKQSYKNRIDSDSDDSEMDDFIDDSNSTVDISAEIRSIFNYDRRRFVEEDDFDDRSMETNRFADVMREEARSARIGRAEDLEDMQREERENQERYRQRKKHKRL